MDQQDFWDEATRRVVVARVEDPPTIRFFTGDELTLMRAVLDRLVPQSDRDEEHRIPLVNYIDERLHSGRIDGYRYEDMPPDAEAYHLGLRGIDAVARQMHGQLFAELGPTEQDSVLWASMRMNHGAGTISGNRCRQIASGFYLMSDAVDAYYCHPYAWDEIGFGGPSYPRGYFRLENGQAEPWEVNEQRYEWVAPPTALSDRYQPLGGRHPHRAPAGQEGTH